MFFVKKQNNKKVSFRRKEKYITLGARKFDFVLCYIYIEINFVECFHLIATYVARVNVYEN
jgi:hypothetical protein